MLGGELPRIASVYGLVLLTANLAGPQLILLPVICKQRHACNVGRPTANRTLRLTILSVGLPPMVVTIQCVAYIPAAMRNLLSVAPISTAITSTSMRLLLRRKRITAITPAAAGDAIPFIVAITFATI
jgi:hypothetical protein